MDNRTEVRDFLATRRARLSCASLASVSAATPGLNAASSVKCPTTSPDATRHPPPAIGLDQADIDLNLKATELQDTLGPL